MNENKKTVDDRKKCFTILKPITETMEKTGVVYKLNCKDCSGTYIGQTKQYLYRRLANHKTTIRNNKSESSAPAKHALESAHQFDFEQGQIIASENDYYNISYLKSDSLYFYNEIYKYARFHLEQSDEFGKIHVSIGNLG